jgi:bifunctional UDP-N-acetylglucosamine pyrophosphorylase/glucosamine-1-phosphate N-acetyltransferase
VKDTIGAVILAAGEGKRLKLNAPKPLAPCLDQKLIDFPILELKKFFQSNNLIGQLSVVVGHKKELVQNYVESRYKEIQFPVQEKQLGTADALRSYFNSGPETHKNEFTLVICADTPVVSSLELSEMFSILKDENLDGVAATFLEENPTGYGRIVRGKKGFHIIEEKDASAEIKKVQEVNSGIYILKTSYVLTHLKEVDSNNKSGEFYLTVVFKDGLNVKAHLFNDKNTFLGVNTLLQLETVERVLRERIINFHRENGVRFIDSRHVYIDSLVEIGCGTVIYPSVHLTGATSIGENVVIENGAIVKNSVLDDFSQVLAYSVLENVHMKTKSVAGPFARLRPGTVLGEESKIGNFVELKKAVLEKGVKVSHLSYVGDAFIGEETNIGCGFITCNYDGKDKHLTKIGKHCFIGSDSQTVAPVEIGDDCFVASSSTITKNMPSGSFAISRGQQITKEGLAHRFIKKK